MNIRSGISPRLVSLLTALLMVALLLLTVLRPAAGASREGSAAGPQMRLMVDRERHARAFCAGLPAMVAIGGFFEMYEPERGGGRRRVFIGPWGGELRTGAGGAYSLKGRDPASGAEYHIDYRQVDSRKLELVFRFRSPSRPVDLSFDVVKLAGDLFRGASLETAPPSLEDAARIPADPLPVARRMLFTGKNRVVVRGALCDLEITDLEREDSLLGADFRAVPWDKEKGIYLGVEKPRLDPNRLYTFRYSIRSLPPSGSDALLKRKAAGAPAAADDGSSYFATPAKEEISARGYYRLSPGETIHGDPKGSAEQVLARELQRLTSVSHGVKASATAGGRGIRFEQPRPGRDGALPPEGFELVVGQREIVIRGADARSRLYGAYALLSRLKPFKGGWRAACGTVRDWPDLPRRGICIEMLAPAVGDVSLFKRYLDAISRAGGNLVVFNHEPAHLAAWRRGDSVGWTREQMSEVADHARFLQLDVWAGIGSKFFSADFPRLPLEKGANFYDPLDEDSYRIVFPLYEELLSVYRPSTVLIGHDEIRGLSLYASGRKTGEADLFAASVARLHGWLSARGVSSAVWGDMLLDHGRWEKEVGDANSMNPYFRSGATHEALGKLPRDLTILDWHYNPKGEYGSIGHFRKSGLRVLGAPWHDPKAAESLARSVKKFGGEGVVGTDWGFWRTLSPAATTLAAVRCGWSQGCGTSDDSDIIALAGMLRGPVLPGGKGEPVPVDLGGVANRSTRDDNSGRGIFDIGPVLDLRPLAGGSGIFGGVTFRIAATDGLRNNCIVVGNTAGKSVEREKRVPAGDRPARAIAFLQTALVPEPQVAPRTLGEYVIEYEGGRTVSVPLRENWNMTDVRSSGTLRSNPWTFSRSPEVLVGSVPGWRGESLAGIPLNLQVFVWHNPHPEERIRSVTLKSADTVPDSRLALLGMTLLQ